MAESTNNNNGAGIGGANAGTGAGQNAAQNGGQAGGVQQQLPGELDIDAIVSDVVNKEGSEGGGNVGVGDGVSAKALEIDLTDKVSKYKEAILDVETGGMYNRFRAAIESEDEDDLIEIYSKLAKKEVKLDDLGVIERERAIKKMKSELVEYFDSKAEEYISNFKIKIDAGDIGAGVGAGAGVTGEDFVLKTTEVYERINSGELKIGGVDLRGVKEAIGGLYDMDSKIDVNDEAFLARMALALNEKLFNTFLQSFARQVGQKVALEVRKRYAGAPSASVGVGGAMAGGTAGNPVMESLLRISEKYYQKAK